MFFTTSVFLLCCSLLPPKKLTGRAQSEQAFIGEDPTGRNYSPWIICACRTLPALALCMALAQWTETEGFDLWLCHNRPPEDRWRWATMLMEPPVSRWQGMQKFSPRITAASVHTLCNLIPVGRQCRRLIMLWKASGWTSRTTKCTSFLIFDLISNSARTCVFVCMCPSLTDSDDICKCVCHMPGQPTPPGCVGGDTLHSVWHAAGCPGLSRGSGGDCTMMCFMGINVDTPSNLYSTPQPLGHLALLNVERRHIPSACVPLSLVWLSAVLCSPLDRECGRLPQFPGRQRSERTRALSRR